MKLSYVQLNAYLKDRVKDSSQFMRIASIALGVSIGRSAPMPEGMEAPTRSFYAEHMQRQIENQIAAFNENIVVDVDLAADTARSIWLVRAGLCHPQPMIEITQQTEQRDPIVLLSGAAYVIDPQVYQTLSQHSECIFVMANRITAQTSLKS